MAQIRLTSISTQGAVARVHPVLLDAREELGLLDRHRLLHAPLNRVEQRRAQARSGQPAQAPATKGYKAEGDERVQRDLGQQRIHVDVDEQDRACRAADHHREEAAD